MTRGARIGFSLVLLAVSAARAESCYTTQSTGASSPAAAAQFRIARRVELVDWARGEKSLSTADAQKLDDLRAKAEELRKEKHWEEAEAAINQAMKLLGIVNKVETALPGC
jgi:hypothetical protein